MNKFARVFLKPDGVRFIDYPLQNNLQGFISSAILNQAIFPEGHVTAFVPYDTIHSIIEITAASPLMSMQPAGQG